MSDGVKVLLIGCGKMGGAMLEGWRSWPGFKAVVVEPKAPVETGPSVALVASESEIARDFDPDAVVIAVKPQEMDNVASKYRRYVRKDTVFLSIAAGKTIQSFEDYWDDDAAIVRAMPNTPAAVGRGVAVLVAERPRLRRPARALPTADGGSWLRGMGGGRRSDGCRHGGVWRRTGLCLSADGSAGRCGRRRGPAA